MIVDVRTPFLAQHLWDKRVWDLDKCSPTNNGKDLDNSSAFLRGANMHAIYRKAHRILFKGARPRSAEHVSSPMKQI